MTRRLVYWAQALDNASDDHIRLREEDLAPEDSVRRQEAVSLVSNVIKSGSRIFGESGVVLTTHGHLFVVEVPCAERDRADRAAPIICCGEYNRVMDDAFGALVAEDISNFARRIGRTILPEHMGVVRGAFGDLKKKERRILAVGGIALVALVLLVLVYVLASRGSS